MRPTVIIFILPQFEIRNFGENDWNEVPEKEFLLKLADTFERIAPILSEMFQGKEISTPNCIYRIIINPH